MQALFRQKDPKPFPPRSPTLNRSDANDGEADQLAGLRQGLSMDLSVSPVGRPAGGKSLIWIASLAYTTLAMPS